MIENTFPLETFYPQLCLAVPVIDALKDNFPDNAEDIINKLKSGIELQGDEIKAEYIIADLVSNDSEIVDTLTGYGYDGEFSIEIMKLGPVFWIRAPEFDNIGFFNSSMEAGDYASYNFEPYSRPRDGDD